MVDVVPIQIDVLGDGESLIKGNIRPALRVSLDSTISELLSLIAKVSALGNQAEQYYWDTRAHNLIMYESSSDIESITNPESGAQQICCAAYPMLDELLERLAYLADETFVALDEEDWDIDAGSPTRTFYNPIVQSVCSALRSIVEQTADWSKTAAGWDNLTTIQEIYGEALKIAYQRARELVCQLGPLWPAVLCNSSVVTQGIVGVAGNLEKFLPTHAEITVQNTHYFDVKVYSGAYVLNLEALFDADWACEKEAVGLNDEENVYLPRGGLCAIEKYNGDQVIPLGTYEILELDADTMRLSNERLLTVDSIAPESDSITGVTFLFRFIRKRETQEDQIAVQYRASNALFKLDDEEMQSQNYTWDLDDEENAHIAPRLVVADEYQGEYMGLWNGYISNVPVLPITPGSEIENLLTNTVCIAELRTLQVGFSGFVHAVAVDGDGNYWVGGDFTAVISDSEVFERNGLAVINADGSVSELEWDIRLTAGQAVRAIHIYDGNVYVGGNFTILQDGYEVGGRGLAKIVASTGAIIPDWGLQVEPHVSSGGTNSLGIIYTIASIDDESNPGIHGIYLGGTFTKLGAWERRFLAKITWDGQIATDWVFNVNGTIRSLVVDGDNNLYVGGFFSYIGSNTTARSLARIDDTPAVDAAYVVTASGNPGRVYAMALLEESGVPYLYIGGKFDDVGGSSRDNLAKIKISDGAVQSAIDCDDTVWALCVGPDDKLYVGGSFTLAASTARGGFAVFNASTLDAINFTFNTGYINTLFYDPGTDDVFIGGTFTQVTDGVGTKDSFYLCRRLVDGTIGLVPWAVTP